MVSVNDILRGNALLLSLYRDRHTMLITATDKHHLLTLQTKIAGIDICRHIHTGKMPDMYRTIRIGKRRCNQRAFKFLIHCQYYKILL